MKKTLLACAVLGAFCAVAQADDATSLNLYGVADAGIGKYVGTTGNTLIDPYTSRIGLRGSENLGDGWKAIFNVESWFDLANGSVNGTPGGTGTTAFWGARSVVGLSSPFGTVTLGREYTPALQLIAGAANPWGPDDNFTLNTTVALLGGVDPVRLDSSVNYSFSNSGFTVLAQVAGRSGTNSDGDNKQRPWGLGASYAGGPFYAALAYSDPADSKDKWLALTASYNLEVVKLGAAFGSGNLSSDTTQVLFGAANGGDKVQSWDLYATAPLGAGEARLSYAQLRDKTTDTYLTKPLTIGYFYNLSKRTGVYIDFSRDSVPTTDKNGYDIGLRHAF